jgi:hypothetical protein
MAKICPQRIIAEAVRLLNEFEPQDEGESEAMDNNLAELEELSKRLYQAGITAI